jgi:hypothetical protein
VAPLSGDLIVVVHLYQKPFRIQAIEQAICEFLGLFYLLYHGRGVTVSIDGFPWLLMKASHASRCACSELNSCSSPSSDDLRV